MFTSAPHYTLPVSPRFQHRGQYSYILKHRPAMSNNAWANEHSQQRTASGCQLCSQLGFLSSLRGGNPSLDRRVVGNWGAKQGRGAPGRKGGYILWDGGRAQDTNLEDKINKIFMHLVFMLKGVYIFWAALYICSGVCVSLWCMHPCGIYSVRIEFCDQLLMYLLPRVRQRLMDVI